MGDGCWMKKRGQKEKNWVIMVSRILMEEVFVVLKRLRLLSGSKSGDFAQQVTVLG